MNSIVLEESLFRWYISLVSQCPNVVPNQILLLSCFIKKKKKCYCWKSQRSRRLLFYSKYYKKNFNFLLLILISSSIVLHQRLEKASFVSVLTLAYQSLGVVYGDLSISPLYVYKTTFSGKLRPRDDDVEIYGVLSFIFWTLTLIALCKYIFIVMSANDNGEGTSSSCFWLSNFRK